MKKRNRDRIYEGYEENERRRKEKIRRNEGMKEGMILGMKQSASILFSFHLSYFLFI